MTSNSTLSANSARGKRDTICQRIEDACKAHSREPDCVALLAVSKKQPISRLRELYALGQRSFGENYVQEALEKMPLMPSDVDWHFIGPIQSNKTRAIAEHFSWVHSVASEKVARRLSEQRPHALPDLQLCIQVNLEEEASKQGLNADGAIRLARYVRTLPRVKLRGLMTIPPPSDDPKEQQRMFARVRDLAHRIGPDCATLSMGMSADLEAAIAAGSTIVRIGTALFGPREQPPE